jgi:ATP-dependent DNA helicase UvrD/PcrA
VQLTSQQSDFIDVILESKRHVALRARAGTGKTSTVIEATDAYVQANPRCEIAICAFGKSIADEISAKLRAKDIDWKRANGATTHSLGFGLVRTAFEGVKVDNAKVRNLIRAENLPVFNQFYGAIHDMVHLGKVEGFGFFDDVQVGDVGAWYRMAEHYGINAFDRTSDMDAVIEASQLIYRKSLEQTEIVDFDDMVLFPLEKNLRVRYGKDLVVLDEAQDTSRARRALIKKFLKPVTGRLAIVGDDRQAIMAFAGASADALDELITEMDALVLPLTQTWRCPKSVVRLAQTIVPDIEAAEEAIEGSVTHVDVLPSELGATDAILCRNTSPLVTCAYQLIRRGVPCKVEGREIGNGLLRVVDRWTTIKTITAFLDKLNDWQARETQKLIAKGKEDKVQDVEDKCDTLRVICQAVKEKGQHSLDAVRTFIRSLFADNVQQGDAEEGRPPMLTLATYHRSKGREWPRVMLLEHSTRCPSPYAKQEYQLRQERNLEYVAITRTQRELIFVN